LSNDGTKLIASSSAPSTHTGSIKVLDPATLATLSTTALSNSLEPTFTNTGFGIQTTNDGRSWLAVGDQFAEMMFFRADTLEVTRFAQSFSFFGGPWFTASRDGERLIVVQSAGLSPAPPMLYMDAADSVLKVNPANLNFSYQIDVNEDGSRVLFDRSEVRDADFNLIGRLSLPTTAGQPTYFPVAARLTVDGNRAYVLAYRDDLYSPGVDPLVFVFDTRTAQATEDLPALGYFDLPEYPSCKPASPSDYGCNYSSVVGAISLDSSTLFFAGNERLLVVPIPGTLTPLSLGNVIGSRTIEWHLDAAP
jgi:hypothetical protein